MKAISTEEFDAGIYQQIEEALDKITLWQHPETGLWWVKVDTTAHAVEGVDSVTVAYALDRSERADTAVIRFATSAALRAAHPEEEEA